VRFRLLRQEVEARITAKIVEIFHRGTLVAFHLRSPRPWRPGTAGGAHPEHASPLPGLNAWAVQCEAAATGDDTAALVKIVLSGAW
jgi:hypothetical protein